MVTKPQIFPVLDEARRIVRSAAPGHNVLRYLMLQMHNQVLKPQYYREGCGPLSGLKLAVRLYSRSTICRSAPRCRGTTPGTGTSSKASMRPGGTTNCSLDV